MEYKSTVIWNYLSEKKCCFFSQKKEQFAKKLQCAGADFVGEKGKGERYFVWTFAK